MLDFLYLVVQCCTWYFIRIVFTSTSVIVKMCSILNIVVLMTICSLVLSKPLLDKETDIEKVNVKDLTIIHRDRRDNPDEDMFVFPLLFPQNSTVSVEVTESDEEEVVDVKIIPKLDEVVICSLLGRCAEEENEEKKD